jgi:hypothetical protein
MHACLPCIRVRPARASQRRTCSEAPLCCRIPDSCGLGELLRQNQKVVASLTFRKHLYALFPSGHHIADDYCHLLVAHYRHLAACFCKSLTAVNRRLPEGSNTARVKSWVTFLMGWESLAAAPRLSHLVRQAQALVDLSSVLLTQTQVCTCLRISPCLSHCHRLRHTLPCTGLASAAVACDEQTGAVVSSSSSCQHVVLLPWL